MSLNNIEQISADVVIVGSGGAGLRAAIEAAKGGADVLVLSKVPPLRSHTVAAQGGINAALGNVNADDWRWHAYDTVRGGDWLVDQDVVAHMCAEAPEAIIELEHMGMAFSRLENGAIYQRAYGGQRGEYGKGDLAHRACSVADRTGHSLMHTLFTEARRSNVGVMQDCMALDLLRSDDGSVCGLLAWQFEEGVIRQIGAKHVIIASGGFGQAWQSTTASSICTGDGNAMALRAGFALQDMEFVQFHPTSLYGTGVLVSEGARGEGAHLLNGNGERFMERYAPNSMELTSRDVISRAIQTEIAEGRGAGAQKDHVLLSLKHLNPDYVKRMLPNVLDVAKTFARIDAMQEAIPVIPAVHYNMGGIASDVNCGLYEQQATGLAQASGISVVGEAASNSVHGANRLGCNSLLDLVVFGKRAGAKAAEQATKQPFLNASKESLAFACNRLERFQTAQGSTSASAIKKRTQQAMYNHAGVFKHQESMAKGLAALEDLQRVFKEDLAGCSTNLCWNSELMDIVETENLLLQALAVMHAASTRLESRGAHHVAEHPKRDDAAYLHHITVSTDKDNRFHLNKRDVVQRADDYDLAFPPEERNY